VLLVFVSYLLKGEPLAKHADLKQPHESDEERTSEVESDDGVTM
jgi:hypothetical protein